MGSSAWVNVWVAVWVNVWVAVHGLTHSIHWNTLKPATATLLFGGYCKARSPACCGFYPSQADPVTPGALSCNDLFCVPEPQQATPTFIFHPKSPKPNRSAIHNHPRITSRLLYPSLALCNTSQVWTVILLNRSPFPYQAGYSCIHI